MRVNSIFTLLTTISFFSQKRKSVVFTKKRLRQGCFLAFFGDNANKSRMVVGMHLIIVEAAYLIFLCNHTTFFCPKNVMVCTFLSYLNGIMLLAFAYYNECC